MGIESNSPLFYFQGFFLSHYFNSEFIFHQPMNYLLSSYQIFHLFRVITFIQNYLVQIIFLNIKLLTYFHSVIFHKLISKFIIHHILVCDQVTYLLHMIVWNLFDLKTSYEIN